MEELKFDKETAEALYRIFCGLSSSCYDRAEVYEEAKPNMRKVYDRVLEWGRLYCDDMRGEKLVGMKIINNHDESIKGEIQNLRTEINLYKKCLGQIYFDIEHLKRGSYDYGEAAEDLLSDIKVEINNINAEVRVLKRGKNF